MVSGGRVRGVVLEGGEEIEAPVVASNLDPHVTFLRLVEEGELDPEFRESIRQFRIEGTSLKINLALSGLPDFRALPGARAAASRHHAHLPVDRVRRARLGRRQVRPAIRPAVARNDRSDDV